MEGGVNHHDSCHFIANACYYTCSDRLDPTNFVMGSDINDLFELNKEVLIWQPVSDYKQTVSQSCNRTDFPPTFSNLPPPPAIVASDL